MPDIIVVDDEPAVAAMLADYLTVKGNSVRAAHNGSELRAQFEQRRADLVVLDLNLPGEDGFSIARWLREHHETGILMLTAAETVFDTIAGLESGADGYLTKPVALSELEARIGAILRRRRPKEGTTILELPSGSYQFGAFVFDQKNHTLKDALGVEVSLTPMELDLVAAFATRPGKVITRDELLDLAPPRTDETYDRSIDSRVTRLRRRLERDPAKPELIKTVRGSGYVHPKPLKPGADPAGR